MQDIAFIALTNGGYCVVDADLFPMLNAERWYKNRQGQIYQTTNCYIPGGRGERRTILMHRIVNLTPEGIQTDHINGTPWDNRRSNLRNADSTQNHWNMRKRKGLYSSKYKGVSLERSPGRRDAWRAQICIGRKNIYLGRFRDEVEAAKCYDEAAREQFGIYAKLNFT